MEDDPILYEVVATARDDRVAAAWVSWMRSTHIADVVDAGALRGRLIHLDEPLLTYVAQYEFASRAAFEAYLWDKAPALRAEGAARFEPEDVLYSRRSGRILAE